MARGDHFFVWRRFGVVPFQHHAIDLGDGDVIHFSDGSGGAAGPAADMSQFVVSRISLQALTQGTQPIHLVRHGKPQGSADETIARAESQLDRRGYHLFHDNCEHFATWCVTGKSLSVQSETAAVRAGSVAVKATVVVAVRLAIKSTRWIKPWTLAADAVQFGTESVGHHLGLVDPAVRKQTGRALGGLTALGIGALGGPVGIVIAGGTWMLGEVSGEVAVRALRRNC